ncbi:hypothetical protein OPV22_014597 [Ensete ventricosum]|uniref:Uncharacterized protein n=1 Tax=Ensete ventricosum TaxID=4639 RepID=A0AAV8R6F2_ENSVE|nr:hypothetical protein OPV22_014597 [Ensete ventricosum]
MYPGKQFKARSYLSSRRFFNQKLRERDDRGWILLHIGARKGDSKEPEELGHELHQQKEIWCIVWPWTWAAVQALFSEIMKPDDKVLLFLGDISLLDIRSKIIQPPQPATLTTSIQSCNIKTNLLCVLANVRRLPSQFQQLRENWRWSEIIPMLIQTSSWIGKTDCLHEILHVTCMDMLHGNSISILCFSLTAVIRLFCLELQNQILLPAFAALNADCKKKTALMAPHCLKVKKKNLSASIWSWSAKRNRWLVMVIMAMAPQKLWHVEYRERKIVASLSRVVRFILILATGDVTLCQEVDDNLLCSLEWKYIWVMLEGQFL